LATVDRFTNLFTRKFTRKRGMYDNKDSHLTWNVLLQAMAPLSHNCGCCGGPTTSAVTIWDFSQTIDFDLILNENSRFRFYSIFPCSVLTDCSTWN